MNSQELRALQEAYNQVYELDEAEGSYGQTPKASAAYTALATGKAKSKTKSLALKHAIRAAGDDNSDKPSPKRSKMTQSDRDYHRGQSENGGEDREGIDFDEFDTGASGPGGKPKGKKLERQIKRGVSAESFDLYDIILSHLLDEGYADTEQAAEAIMVNMSEDWRESIVEEVLDEKIATPPSRYNMRRRLDPEKRRLRRSSDFHIYGGENQDPDERTISTSKGEGGITKNPKKLLKQKAMGEHG
jgi:hypothetical protein